MALLLLGRTGGIRTAPLVKSLAAAVVTGGGLCALTGLVLTGLESKLQLVAKCVGMGAAAAAVYLLLLLLLRQEDLLERARRYRRRG